MIENVGENIVSWTTLYLSRGGRVMLIKGTLSSIPTYFMSLFNLPSSVANKLDKL